MAETTVHSLGAAGFSSQGLLGRSVEWKIHWLLRLGVAMEFIGHGACGVHTKAGWLPFFNVFAIPEGLAYKLMPWVGSMDIALGIAALLAPRRALFLYMAIWGCFTAMLRPAAGQGWWEFFERAYNYGVPFTLLLLYATGAGRNRWFASLGTPPALSPERRQTLLWILRVIVVLMLIGHGGFGPFMAKKNLLGFYQAAGLGIFGLPLETIRAGIGFFEIGLGVMTLFAARPAFFLFIVAWKIASESLFFAAGDNLACWEFANEGAAMLRLWLCFWF